jgi:hypothetical protein
MSRALDTLFVDLPARLSVEQLTEILGLSEKTVTYWWLREGRVPAIRLSGTWVIFCDDIKEHLEASYNTKPGFDGTSSPAASEKPSVVADDGIEEKSQDVASEPTGEDEQRPARSTGGAASRHEYLQRIRH